MLSGLLALAVFSPSTPTGRTPYQSRFQMEAPCPSAPALMIDRYGSGIGLASETARSKNWQARVLWIDATANLDQYNRADKIHNLIAKIADSGFNTVVLDIKPISGQTIYPSQFAPKLTEWRGQKLPADFDPVPVMAAECHQSGLFLIVSMNAFSEGHRLFKVGPGYNELDQQSVLYLPKPVVRIGTITFPLADAPDQIQADNISILSSPSKFPKTQGFGVKLSPDGKVESNSGLSTWNQEKGTLLFGSGKGAEFLKSQATAGSHVEFDTEAEFVKTSAQPGGQIPLMMDPLNPQVQEHALALVHEVMSKYAVDGMIYDDRLRYAGIDADFSETTRTDFESYLGKKLTWPDDVFKFTLNANLSKGIKPGQFYDAWFAWRAQQIKTYVAKVRDAVKEARPAAQFGAYVGSWYGDYPALGHNYASSAATPGFWFDTAGYRAKGTASLFDYLMVGSYYPTATIYEAMQKGVGLGYTVEASGALCNRLSRSETWTYAGIDCGMFISDPSGLANVIQAACAATQGVMVFDLSHGVDKLWPTFKRIFGAKQVAPHQVHGSVEALRKKQALVDTFRQPEQPIIILNGASGTGQ